MPRAPSREEREIDGTRYSGNQEQVALYESGKVKTPEEAGLSLAQRKTTWRDTAEDVTQGAGRVAAQVGGGALGLLGGGLPGMVAGSAAGGALMEAGIKAGEDFAGGEDETGTYMDALGRGAEEGAVTGLMGGAGGVLGRLGGKAAGRLAPSLGKVGRVGGEIGGEIAGMAGVSAAHDVTRGKAPGLHNLGEAAVYTGAGRALGGAVKKLGGALRPGPASGASEKVGRALKKPLETIETRESVGLERSGKMGTGVESTRKGNALKNLRDELDDTSGLKEAEASMGPHTERTRLAASELKTAQFEKKALENRSYEALREKYAGAGDEARAAVKAGEEKARMILGETWQDSVKVTSSEKSTARFDRASIAEIVANPTTLRADVLEKHPAIAHIFNTHLTPSYAPMHADANVTLSKFLGANDMQSRARRVRADLENVGPGEFQKKWKKTVEALARYFLAHRELGGGLAVGSPEAQNLAKAALGKVTRETSDSVLRTFQTRVSGKGASPELSKAIERYRLAQEAMYGAQAALKGAPESTALAGAKQRRKDAEATISGSDEWRAKKVADKADRDQLLRAKEAAHKYSQIDPGNNPYANFGATWLGAFPFLRKFYLLLEKPAARILSKMGDVVGDFSPEAGRAAAAISRAARADMTVARAMAVSAAQQHPEIREWLEAEVAEIAPATAGE